MTPEELAEGYAWCYRRLFSHRSIWRRRPADPVAVPPYLAMSYLYKRSNRLWYFLIRHRLTGLVWRPLVEWTRRRHTRFRRRLAERDTAAGCTAPSVVTAGGYGRCWVGGGDGGIGRARPLRCTTSTVVERVPTPRG